MSTANRNSNDLAPIDSTTGVEAVEASEAEAAPSVEAQATRTEPEAKPKKARLGSLDALRGLTILLMLLVNNTALDVDTPAQLQHAPWGGGATVADMVFPWFLFCAGLSIPFSVASARRRGDLGFQHEARVVFRALALVLIGILVQSVVARQPAVGLGVLGLIGLSTFVGAYAYDLSPFRRGVVTVFLLGFYGFALLYLPHSHGGPGFAEQRNLVKYLNEEVLGRFYLAGLPSVVPTSALVILGTLVGERMLPSDEPARERLLSLFGYALIFTGIGWAWNLGLPFNKTVWTPSYILFTAGLATFLLAVFHGIVDIRGWRAWTFPLVVFGSNAIVAYVLPILVKVLVLQRFKVGDQSLQDAFLGYLKGSLGHVPGGWAYTVLYIGFWWLALLVLYRRKWFLRV